MTERTDRNRETALRAYFSGAPGKLPGLRGIWLLVVASVLLLISVSLFSNSGSMSGGCAMFFAVPGIVVGLWGGGRLLRVQWNHRRRRLESAAGPGDEEVQGWLDQGISRVKDGALQSLGLSEEELVSDLLTIVAPVVWTTTGIGAGDLLFRTGSAGCARFGVYSIAVIALTDRHLGSFRCEYNFLQDTILDEKTCEYHYRDIVSVSTSEVSTTLLLPSGETRTTVQEFRVSVPNGEAIRITVDAPEIRRMIGADSFPSSGAEKAVRAIRAMLRQKKA